MERRSKNGIWRRSRGRSFNDFCERGRAKLKRRMKSFASLVTKLGSSTSSNEKLDALANYFSLAEEKDRVWVVALFSGRRPRRLINSSLLPQWCIELTGIPSWLFGECYGAVGDLAETIALLLPDGQDNEAHLPLSFY